jgi:hypothetical protein
VTRLGAVLARNAKVKSAYACQIFDSQSGDPYPRLCIALDDEDNWDKIVGDLNFFFDQISKRGDAVHFLRMNNSNPELEAYLKAEISPFYQRNAA